MNGSREDRHPWLLPFGSQQGNGVELKRASVESVEPVGFRPPALEPPFGKKLSALARFCGIKGIVAEWLMACLLVAGLAFLGWFSFHLASVRILQVDECGNVFAARYLAQGQAAKLNGSIDLFQVLLSPLARGTAHAIDLFVNARFLMFEVFWLNILLIAMATGERLLSVRGVIALAGAATLAPLWDYGFEVRHDNLVLTAVLLTWCTVRRGSRVGRQGYFVVGALMVIAQFLAAKSFVYTIPISVSILLFRPPQANDARWKLALMWLGGALTAFGILFCVYRSAGLWHGYIEGGRSMSALATGTSRFGPWSTLARLLTQTPLLLGLVLSALAACILDLLKRRRAAFSWEGCLPEAGLFTVSLAVLFINPTPYPYNLLHLIPYAFLLAWRYSISQWNNTPNREGLLPAVASIILFAHVIPFTITTHRHTERPNYRQERLMRLAEDMTDPHKDPVYDAIGMVMTRPIVDRRAFLHGLSIGNFLHGSNLRLRDMLAANPPAVIIPSYRY